MNGKPWTDEDRAKLAELYPHQKTTSVAKALNRTVSAVNGQAHKMGLKKTAEHLAAHARFQKGERTNPGTEFKKGQAAWNKGKTGFMGANRTSFKKGHKPKNWKPIGTERVTREGYIQRKVTDTGNTVRDYVEVHRLLWEEANGKIPTGHVIIFKDGNKQNITLDNLELISRGELARRNSIHRLPEELKGAIRQLASLKRGIKKHEQKSKRPERNDV